MPPLSERVAPPETLAEYAGIIDENAVQNEVDALNVDLQAQEGYYTPFYTELCKKFGVDPTKPASDYETPIADQIEKQGRHTLAEPEAAGHVAVANSIELIITRKPAPVTEKANEATRPSPWFTTKQSEQKQETPPPMWPPISAPPLPTAETPTNSRPTARISITEALERVAAETNAERLPVPEGMRVRISRGHEPIVEPTPVDKPIVQRLSTVGAPPQQPKRWEPVVVHNTVKPVAIGDTDRIPEPVAINGPGKVEPVRVVPVVPGKENGKPVAPELGSATAQVFKQTEAAPKKTVSDQETAKVGRLQRVGNWIKKIIGRDEVELSVEDKLAAELKQVVFPDPPVLRKGETIERPITSNTTTFGTPRRRVSSNPEFKRDADDSEAMERAKKFQAIDEEKIVAAENEQIRQKRLDRAAKFLRGYTRTVIIGGVYPVVDKVYPMVEAYMQHRGR